MSAFTSLPPFPEFRPLVFEDRALFEEMFRRFPPNICAYTFANLYGWNEIYDFRLARFHETLLVMGTFANGPAFYPPIGDISGEEIVSLLTQSARGGIADSIFNADDALIARIDEASLKRLQIAPEEGEWDYIHRRQDLMTLSGRKLHRKKNNLNHFLRHCRPTVFPLCEKIVPELFGFFDEWNHRNHREENVKLVKENKAIKRMLGHCGELNLLGTVILLEERIVACSYGVALNPATYVVHIEKAFDDVRGLYQFVGQQTIARTPTELVWINRENDLDIEGLRKSKRSYQPDHFTKKYRIRLREAWDVNSPIL